MTAKKEGTSAQLLSPMDLVHEQKGVVHARGMGPTDHTFHLDPRRTHLHTPERQVLGSSPVVVVVSASHQHQRSCFLPSQGKEWTTCPGDAPPPAALSGAS
jgi:hypothetical protein